ncbi:expressed unknown protein [Seminavis robusta]|uniref:J domain-containing protein n=1 Tax=Seminavis robusta TaxID=568900 RepID=A0A9N8EC73_9STRA|nr:expressed unknown protein [Seminavis robusta]|eukprot:Sro734_g194650.1 n/a (402) ;mRNA; f:16445-17650
MMYASAGIEDEFASIDGASGAGDYDEPSPNLEVIYQAFGEHADLYKDVLQVKSSATAEQIQMAYFDRRSELFALLASIDSEEEQDDITASHRFHAERKMDAVVMAVRILGDPQLREEYDNVVLRQTKKQPQEPPSGGNGSGASRSSSTREPDGVYAGLAEISTEEPPASPRATRSPKRRTPKRRSPRHVSPSENDTSDDNANPMSSDEMLMNQYDPHDRHHHHSTDPEYEFISLSNTGSGSKGSGKNKHKKSHKKKHQEYHPSNHHQHDQYPNESADLSTLNSMNRDDDTYPETSATYDTNTYQDETTLDRTWEEQGTIVSGSTNGDWTRDGALAPSGTSTLSAITRGGIVSRIQEEVAGTVEDTLVSFEQVLNAFTLQEREIQAVMGRIDKAKRQLRKRR